MLPSSFLKQPLALWGSFLLLLAALPLLLLICHPDQSWGGDYAGYLTQAREILRGHTQLQPYYIYNPGRPYLAPPVYPVGFSLLEAVFLRGNTPDMLFFVRLNTVLWWLSGVALFWVARRHVPLWAAAGGALFYLFHPIYLLEKNSVLPDAFFCVLIWLTLDAYIYRSTDSWKKALWCGFLAAGAWLTRANGVVLLLAIGLYQVPVLVQYLWKKERRAVLLPELRFSALVLLSAGALYLSLQQGVYAHPELQGSYLDQLRLLNNSLRATLSLHAEECVKNTLNYFQMGMEVAQLHKGTRPDIAAQLGGAIALGFVVLGMFQPRKGREGLLGIFLVCFVGLLLIWPLVQGFRYLLPVFPALFIYLLRGLDAVKPARRAAQIALWALIPLLWYGEYDRGFKGLKDLSMQNDYGSPEFSNNQEAFQFVRTQIPDTVRLAYHHPLILGLYAERKSMCWQASPPEAMQREFRNFKVDYLLVNNWLSQSDPALEQYLQFYKASLDTVWHNERNCLYRLH